MRLLLKTAVPVMRNFIFSLANIAALALNTTMAASGASTQTRSVVVNGNSGDIQIVQVGGKEYIDIRALVQITQGSLSLQGGQIILNLPMSQSSSQSDSSADPNALSRPFMRAGVEEISLLREWASPLANAIENGFPVTDHWVQGFRAKAADGLRLASVSATTAADKSASELLRNEFAMVDAWSNKLLEAHKTMDSGKYATSHDALKNEPESQTILACAHSLESMLTSGTFQDDGSCRQ